jgi:hypothetical protein
MSFQFNVDVEKWEVEEGVEVDLSVSGTYELDRGNRRGHPDTWTAPWEEIDVTSVTNQQGCPLPPKVVGVLCADDRFLEHLSELIQWRYY